MLKLHSRIIILLIGLFLSSGYSIISSGQNVQTGPKEGRIFTSPEAMLQFTAGRYVLGFAKGEMCVVSAGHALKVEFVNARPVSPEETNQDLEKSRQSVKPLSRIIYRELWERVTLVYEKHRSGVVKSTYSIAPAKTSAIDPVAQIRIRYNTPVKVDVDGNLILSFATGQMKESRPLAWQEIGGRKMPVDVAYRLLSEQEVGFKAGSYNPRYPLTIDPILSGMTFAGGTGDDSGNSIALDANGNIYITGWSNASWGSPIRPWAGNNYDAFVAKLSPAGVLEWNTFLGGDPNDYGYAIGVDASGNVYAAGQSNATWGTPVSPFAGISDGFVAKLNNSGELQWNTFLGGADSDNVNGITVVSGNIYVTGVSKATWGTPVNPFAGGGYNDAFVAKLNGSGALQWNTFLGGTNSDSGYSITLDTAENIYVAGASKSTWGAPISPFAGFRDAFIAKLDDSGALQWNTFLGGTSDDYGFSITLDTGGNIYVAGNSLETWGAPINPFFGTGAYDGFVAKLNGSGALQWNTFLGGAGQDSVSSITVHSSGDIYLIGYSTETWGSPISPYNGGTSDGFAAKLNGDGALQWHGFLGGSGMDSCNSLALDAGANMFIAGTSDATWGSPLYPYAGGGDAFVAKISRTQKVDFAGTWDGQGVYFRNSETGKYVKLATPADLIAAGDLDGDGKADLIGIWPTQGGVWVRYSKTGAWAKLSSTARHIASGDMNGDGRADLLGTWDGQGVFYKDSISGSWVKLASPATLITAGDFDQDTKDDLLGIWPTQGGVWVKLSSSGTWYKVSSTALDIAVGDMNGDGKLDFLGTWDGQGVFFYDGKTWVKMSVPAEQVTAGDLDGDGKDDLIGLWTSQGGIWVKYSQTGAWSKISTPAKDIATGVMRGAFWGSGRFGFNNLLAPVSGYAEGPLNVSKYKDLTSEGPGGWRFAAQEQKNLIPQATGKTLVPPGPGLPGFRFLEQRNLVPQEQSAQQKANMDVEKRQRGERGKTINRDR
jgi:hypothetical protein